MSIYGSLIYENNNSFEEFIESYLNNDSELVQEGANLDLMKEFRKCKKEYKKALNEMKKAIKEGDKKLAKEAKKKALSSLNNMSSYIDTNKKQLSSLSAGLIGSLITFIPTMILLLIGILLATVIPDKVIPKITEKKMKESFENELKNLQSIIIDDDGKYDFDETNKNAGMDFIKAIYAKYRIENEAKLKTLDEQSKSILAGLVPELIALFTSIKYSIRSTKADAIRDNNMLVTTMKDNIKKLKDKVNKIPV